MRNVLSYVIARLNESSTWRGIVLVMTALGAQFEESQREAIMLIGLALAGMIAVAFPDRKPE